MSLPDPAVVDASLRRLDTDALTALAVDLWAARGFEVERRGGSASGRNGDLLAVHDGDTVETVWVVGARRFSRPAAPSESVDVVLAPRAGRTARRVAADADARLVDAASLREMLWYAVERPVWRTLCTEHLGAAPDALTPPLATRLRAAGRDASAATEASIGRVTEAPSLLLAVVAVVLLVASVGLVGTGLTGTTAPDGEFGALGGLVDFGDDGANAADAESSAGATETAETTGTPQPTETASSGDSLVGWTTVEEDPANASLAGVESVPGVTRDGIDNLSALVAAHERSVTNRSYTLWFDSYRQDAGLPETRTQRDVDIAVEGERYLLVTEVERNGTRTRVGRVYYENDVWFVQESGEANGSWQRASSTEAVSIGPSPFDYRSFGLRRYLSTGSTEVVGVRQGPEGPQYRIAGVGTPPGPFSASISNYSVVATVDGDGFVSDLTVEYLVSADQPYQVRYEWTYGRFGETTVDAPPVDE